MRSASLSVLDTGSRRIQARNDEAPVSCVHPLVDIRTLVGRAKNTLPPHHEFVARAAGSLAA
jgi:hypothetical protein